MKRTKNFFIALLGFCLMGSGVMAQSIAYYSNGTTAMAYVLPFNPPTGDVVILDTYEDVPVTEISGFTGNKNITSVTLPSTIVSLPASAFSGCSSLASINLGNVIEIGDYAFSGCIDLESVSLDNVTNIGASAFQGCEKMASSLNLSNVVSIGTSAFQNCKKITSLTIGNPTLGDHAFLSTAVSTLEFVNVTTIPADVATQFAGTLTTVKAPYTVTAVGERAFEGCSKLTSFDFVETYNNIKEIGASAFSGCSSLGLMPDEADLILNGVALGESCFAGTGYSSVTILGTETLPKSVFSSSKITQATLRGVKTIGPSAFESCEGLSSVSMTSIVTIGASAFKGCIGLKKNNMLDFPASLECIETDAFSGTNLKGAYFSAVPEIQTDAFYSKTLVLKIADATAVKYHSTSATFDRVEYTRSAPGNYAAIALPFDFEKGGNTYYELTSFDLEGGMHFTEVETPVANTPYLYQGSDGVIVSSGTYSPSANDDGDVAVSTGVEDWEAVCVYKDHSTQSGDPIIDGYYKWAVQGGSLKYFNGQMYMKPYRAYWKTSSPHVSQNARVFVHTRDGNVTSINMAEIDGLENMVPVYYDLTGRMVNNPVKGNIYIVNGKKVVF